MSLRVAAVIVFAAALGVMDDEEFAISYEGVTLGVPVLTRDRKEFGILEHVLAVEEEDIFEGIVVWVGGGSWRDRMVQRELCRNPQSTAQFLEQFRHHHLRFVPADKVSAITVGYIRCDLSLAEAGQLQEPFGAPVYYANAIDQAGPQRTVYVDQFGNRTYGQMFGVGQWRQE